MIPGKILLVYVRVYISVVDFLPMLVVLCCSRNVASTISLEDVMIPSVHDE